MRALILAMLLGSIGMNARAADAVYDPDPDHLWNRLYRSIAVRTELGVDYGVDASEPFYEPFDDPATIAQLLDVFNARPLREPASGSAARALMLNDVWAAFDLAVRREDKNELRGKLARALGRLAMPAASIATLPDNFAAAAKSGKFAPDFDPAHPEAPFLPPDLFDPKGSWVQVAGNVGGPAASMHVATFSGRSAFLIFIRCPGGREATLSYLKTLNLFPTPYELKPAEMGAQYVPGQPPVPVRMNVWQLNRATPQLPVGTAVALVRQLIVLDDKFDPVPTSITQKVQFRVFRKVEGAVAPVTRATYPDWQAVSELVVKRRDLLLGRNGGLSAVDPDEHEYQLLNRPEGGARAALLRGDVVLTTCGRCHGSPGIFSVNSYGGPLSARGVENPQLLPGEDLARQRFAAATWKQQKFDYGMLRGLLAAGP